MTIGLVAVPHEDAELVPRSLMDALRSVFLTHYGSVEDMPDDEDSSWDPDWARRLIRDLPSPPEYGVPPEYAQGFANAHEYAQELAGALGDAIAEIDRLRAALSA